LVIKNEIMKKKIRIRLIPFMIIGVLLMLLNNCKKETSPASIDEIIFNPDLTYGTLTDIDDNTYKTINIGTQTWMAENLRVIKYNDGTVIPFETEDNYWMYSTLPRFCWYENDASTYRKAYGGLYNWYTVNTGKLCPTGWHVPLKEEWIALIAYLGGDDVAGPKLKETGTTHWISPNTGSTNESGFTALPGGYRGNDGSFDEVQFTAQFWSTTEGYYTDQASLLFIAWTDDWTSVLSYSKTNGMSVRCIKD
jgi:uncharacterized protein (TIGR02145 family)